MRGFYFENHNYPTITKGAGHTLVGELDLEAGSYMVWGKLSLSVAPLQPPDYPVVLGASTTPPLQYGVVHGVAFAPRIKVASGVVTLALGEAYDDTYFSVKEEEASNRNQINLMCAATINRGRRARLYVLSIEGIPAFCRDIKLMALQVDTLAEHELGKDLFKPPEDEEERLHDAILLARLRKYTSSISDLLKDG